MEIVSLKRQNPSRWHENRAEIAVGESRGTQEYPRESKSAQDSPKCAQVGPKSAQVGPKSAQVGTEGAQVGAKLVPRAPKLKPGSAQEATKRVQVEPKRRPRRYKLSQKSQLKAETGQNMKIKLTPARELDFEGPGDPKLDRKSMKLSSKLNQNRVKSLLGPVLE